LGLVKWRRWQNAKPEAQNAKLEMNIKSLVQPAISIGLFSVAMSFGAPAQAEQSTGQQIKVLKTIPLGGEGEWGYPTIDAEARRLYLPRTHIVQVMDIDKGALVGVIPDVSGQVCHGIAIAPEEKLGFASAGKDNNVAAFDPATLKVTARIKSAVNPNATIYDPASKHIVVMNHAAVTIIDPSNLEAEPVVIGTGNGLESAVADGKGSVFVCVENEDDIVRIDTKINKIADHWPVAPGKVPAGIAMDHKSNRLFVTCHSKVSATTGDKTGVLAVIDAGSGKVLSTPPIGAGASGVVFDPVLGLALSANGKDGALSVSKETSPGVFETIQTLKTFVSARHVVLDAKTHRLFLEGNVPADGGQTFGVVVVGVDTLAAKADNQAKKIEIIKLEEAPNAVRDAVDGRFPAAKVSTTERETENGKVVFEVALTQEDRKYEMHIKDDGTIEAVEKEISLNDVPKAVLTAVTEKYSDATIGAAMAVNKFKDKKETLDHYLIAIKVGGKKAEIGVSLDGKDVK
jgi:DNA-binding beta-propeller fold protein YncE